MLVLVQKPVWYWRGVLGVLGEVALGVQSKPAIDESDLVLDSTLLELVPSASCTLSRSPVMSATPFRRSKTPSRFHPLFDESVDLLDYVVMGNTGWNGLPMRDGTLDFPEMGANLSATP